jgi:hypothetical protein
MLGSNNSYHKVRTKQLAKKHPKKGCYRYVEINGNRECREKKHLLDIDIKDNRCKKIIIYKKIKNVDIRDSGKLLDIDMGTTIKKSDKIDIRSITEIENSTIKGSYSNPNLSSNIGIRITTDKNSDIRLNNVKINNSVKVENSTIGNLNHIKDLFEE